MTRGIRLSIWVPSLLVISAAAFGADEQAKSAAMLQAEANKAFAKRAPGIKVQPDNVRPATAALAGEYGTVIVRGIVTEEGRFTEPSVATSSRSEIIDAAAIAFSSEVEFRPARDEAGEPLSFPILFSVEMPAVEFRGDHSILSYSCEQFVRDYDWWQATWPDRSDDRIYATLAGFAATAELGGRLGENPPSFEADWDAAAASCRKKPGRKMIDQLEFYGDFVSEMVRTRG